MKLKGIISALLALTLLMSCVSCDTKNKNDQTDGLNQSSDKQSQGQNQSSGQDDDGAKVYSLANLRENIGDYVIIRSDTSPKPVTDLAVLVRAEIKAVTGIELPLKTDWDEAYEHEIVVGKSNRAGDITDSLKEDGFAVRDDGNGNVILNGYDNILVKTAVESFLSQYFGYKPEAGMIHHNVKDYGAVGDNSTDDTKAFKNAVQAAEKDGLPVYVPAGTYVISDTITLDSVTLYGYVSGAWTADNCDLPKVNQANMQAPLFDVRSGSLAGLDLSCNGWEDTAKKQPAVLITGTGGRVSNMRISNPYIGIFADDTSNPGRCFIENIFIIGAAELGVYVGGTYDVPALNNIEVWNPGETCPVAFKFGHNDDLRAVNLFAFNANVGFLIEQTETGSCWGSFTNCSADFSSIGFLVGEGAHHLTIVGGTYWTHHMGIHTLSTFTGELAATGCEMKSNGERTLNIEGGKNVTITGCNILHDFETETPAVAVSGGTVVNITGNTIYSRALPFELTSRQKDSVIAVTNNVIYTAFDKEVVDTTKKCTVKFDNTALCGMDFSN